jgi:hypothetical protein
MRDTPVPMSNTAVKSHYAGSSWGLPPVRYGRCQAKRSDCEAAFIGSLAQLTRSVCFEDCIATVETGQLS